MTSRHGRQFVPAKNNTRQKIIVAVVVFIILIMLVPPTRNIVRKVFGSFGSGILSGSNSTGGFLGSIVNGFRSKNALEKENADLKAKILEQDSHIADNAALQKENDDLKAMMNRASGMHFTLATILAKPPHSVYDTIIIDGGEKAGIAPEQMVYANGDTPIGVVQSVLSDSAVVLLFSAPGNTLDARLSPSNIDVVLTGRGGGDFETTVPHDLVVDLASAVVTKEINARKIAVLNKIISDPRDPFQTLLLSAPVNVQELSYVEVKQ